MHGARRVCILIGIGILVELVRQVGFAFVEVKRAEDEAKAAKRRARGGDPPHSSE